MSPSTDALRRLALAAIAGTTAALACDLVLQFALSSVRVGGAGSWWVAAILAERGRWVIAAVLLWLALPTLWSAIGVEEHAGHSVHVTMAQALGAVGASMIALPVLWELASIVIRAILITIQGGWPSDGRVFSRAYFYSSLVLGLAPWVLGGAVLVGLARHVRLGEPRA